jgi:hypothetical protein
LTSIGGPGDWSETLLPGLIVGISPNSTIGIFISQVCRGFQWRMQLTQNSFAELVGGEK